MANQCSCGLSPQEWTFLFQLRRYPTRIWFRLIMIQFTYCLPLGRHWLLPQGWECIDVNFWVLRGSSTACADRGKGQLNFCCMVQCDSSHSHLAGCLSMRIPWRQLVYFSFISPRLIRPKKYLGSNQSHLHGAYLHASLVHAWMLYIDEPKLPTHMWSNTHVRSSARKRNVFVYIALQGYRFLNGTMVASLPSIVVFMNLHTTGWVS